MATTTSLGFTIFSKYVGTGVRKAHRDIETLDQHLRKSGKTINKLTGGTSIFTAALVAMAPAAVAVGGALAAMAGGAVAMGVATGAAGGIFVAVLAGMIKKTMDMKDAGEKLSPVQQVFVTNVDQMKSAWDKLLISTQRQTLGVAIDVVAGLRDGIGKLNPLILATYPAIKKVSQAFQDWMRGSGMDRFVSQLTQHGVPALDNMLTAARNLLTFLGNGFRAFLPLGVEVSAVLLRGSAALAAWSNEGGFQRFLANVNQYAPQIKEFFAALWAALKNVLAAIVALGPFALGLTVALLKLIAAMPPEAIQAFFFAFLGFKVLSMVITAVGLLATGIKLLVAAFGYAKIAWGLLNAAFVATPIGWIVLAVAALVAVIVLIATKTTWFQDLWRAVWPTIKSSAESVWTWLKQAWDVLWKGMRDAWEAVFPPIERAFRTVWPELVKVAAIVWAWLVETWRGTWENIKAVWSWFIDTFTPLFRATWEFLVVFFQVAWEVIKRFWAVLWSAVQVVWLTFSAFFTGDWGKVWTAVKDLGAKIWDMIAVAFRLLITEALPAALRLGAEVLKAAWALLWTVIKWAAQEIWDSIVALWKGFWSIIGSIIDSAIEAVKGIWNSAWTAIREEAQMIWDGISGAARAFWSVLTGIFTTALDFLKGVWTTVWDAISAAFNVVMTAIRAVWETVLRPVFVAIGEAARLLMTIILTLLITPFIIAWNLLSMTAKAVWEGILRPVFEAVAAGALWLWNAAIKPAFEAIRNVIVTVLTAVRDFAVAWWAQVSAIFDAALKWLQNLWQTVWNAVSHFVYTIWEAIKAYAQAWWAQVTAIFDAALKWLESLWQTVWNAVSHFVYTIWEAIKAYAQAWWGQVTAMFDAALRWLQNLWNTVWDAVSGFVQSTWNAIVGFARSIFWDPLTRMFDAALKWLQNLWNTVWDAIKNFASSTWNTVVGFARSVFWDPIMSLFDAGKNWILNTFWNPVRDFFTRTIPDAFRTAVDAVGRMWDSIKAAVRAPIQAVIDIVYNKGIVAVWNTVAGAFGGGRLNTYTLPNFATGGPVRGPGTGTSDSITARMSNGEHVWTAREVVAAGGHGAVAALRAMVMGQPVQGPNAGNGFFLGGWIDSVTSFIGNGLAGLKNLVLGGIYPVASKLIDGAAGLGKSAVRSIIPGEPVLEGASVGMIDKIAGAIKDWIKPRDKAPAAGTPWNGTIAPGALGRMQEWALSQQGGRYAWGGVSNKAMDCSGMVGNLWALATGQPLYRRYMTTYTMGAGRNGMQSGPGAFTVYLKQGGPGGGHTSANVGGLHVEAYGGNGTPFAIGRVGTPLSYFDQVLHMPGFARGGPVDVGKLRTHEQAMASFRAVGWPEMMSPPGYAIGTPGARRGLAWTGERGRELVQFRGGERVLSNKDSEALVGRSGGDHYEFNFPIDARGASVEAVRRMETELIPKLRKAMQQEVGKRVKR